GRPSALREPRRRWPLRAQVAAAAALVLVCAALLMQFWPRSETTRPPTEGPGERGPASNPQVLGPFDRLRASDIDPEQRAMAGAGDPQKAPAELVAVLGDGRMHHWSRVNDLGFSPDGKTLGSAGADGTIMLWDLGTGQGRCFQNGVGPGRV